MATLINAGQPQPAQNTTQSTFFVGDAVSANWYITGAGNSLTANSWGNIDQITLGPGKWLLQSVATPNVSHATGEITFSDTTNSGVSLAPVDNVGSATAASPIIASMVVDLTAQTTIYVNFYSTVATSPGCFTTAVQIG